MTSNACRLVALLIGLIAPAAARAADQASIPLPTHHVGDSWVEEKTVQKGTNGFNKQRVSFRIESVGADTMVIGLKPEGSPNAFEDHIAGLDLSQRRIINGKETVTGRPYSFPLTIGKSWTADYINPNRFGLQVSAHFRDTWKATGWEDVTTPAGTFHCVRVEGHGTVEAKFLPAADAVSGTVVTPGDITTVHHLGASGPQTRYWLQTMVFDYAPSIGLTVKSVEEHYNSENVRTLSDTQEIISLKPVS